MKRFVSILLCLSMLIMAFGCDSNDSQGSNDENVSTTISENSSSESDNSDETSDETSGETSNDDSDGPREITYICATRESFEVFLKNPSKDNLEPRVSAVITNETEAIPYAMGTIWYRIDSSLFNFIGKRENVSEFLRQNDVSGNVKDCLLIYSPYAPLTLWVETDSGHMFITIKEKQEDENYVYRLYTHEEFKNKHEKITSQIMIDGNSIENVTADIYSDCAIVPFIAVLRAMGTEVVKSDSGPDRYLIIVYNNLQHYLLDLNEKALRLYDGGDNLLNIMDGGEPLIYRKGQELFIDQYSLAVVLREIGMEIPKINVDRTNRTINIILNKPVFEPFVEYGYKLFVNDEEVEIEDDKIFLYVYDYAYGDYACNVMVSFVTIMSALDAEFEWQSDTVAKMYWADMTFTLDVEKCKLTDDACEFDSDWIQGACGGRSYRMSAKNDIFVDARALDAFFGMVGLEIRDYPYTERKVDIKTTPKYPQKLEYWSPSGK